MGMDKFSCRSRSNRDLHFHLGVYGAPHLKQAGRIEDFRDDGIRPLKALVFNASFFADYHQMMGNVVPVPVMDRIADAQRHGGSAEPYAALDDFGLLRIGTYRENRDKRGGGEVLGLHDAVPE
jgi:hypothetical protein